VRTAFAPKGRTWTGSAQAVKRFVLESQASGEKPEPLAPRRPGDGSSRAPECKTSRGPVTLAPHGVIRERWELSGTSGLDAVGSAHALIRVEVRSRGLRVERPVYFVLDHPARGSAPGPSLGQLYDRLLANRRLSTLLAAQPPDSWRYASLSRSGDELHFKAVTRRYERAFTATARTDGSRARVTVPGPRDRTRPYPTAPAALPARIRLIDEPKGFVATHDVLPGRLRLPTGRVAADSYFTGETKPLGERAQPGAHPVRITLARSVDRKAGEHVALATLVVSGRPTVRWQPAGGVGVDGGTAAFSSAEGAASLGDLLARDEPGWTAWNDHSTDALAAHDFAVADLEVPGGGGTNVIEFSTGLGDGGYALYVGLDTNGRATRFVLDCGLLHLAWPAKRHGR
jgi:Protein of unknown function (DUF4241)